MRLLAVVVACALFAACDAVTTAPASPSPTPFAAAPDVDLVAALAKAGVTVRETGDSKLQSLFVDTVRARWLRTDDRALEAVVFPYATAAHLSVCEERSNEYVYRLSGEYVRDGPQSMYGTRSIAFLAREQYLVLVFGDDAFATKLRNDLGAVTPLCR